MESINVLDPSHQSVFLTPEIVSADGAEVRQLGTATGFFVRRGSGVALVTARHVLTGRHNDTREALDPMAYLPTHVSISYRRRIINSLNVVGTPLYDDQGNARWLEHPTLGPRADVAVLPVDPPSDARIVTYPSKLEQPIALAPMEIVSVIGFPLGRSTNTLAIWSTGYIASEPDLDHDGVPMLLVSCRTTSGQSGSPVLACRTGDIRYEGDRNVLGGGSAERFIGLYSGRLAKEVDIGRVWKASVVLETAASGKLSAVRAGE